MLYKKDNQGIPQSMVSRRNIPRRISPDQLETIKRRLQELITQKGYNANYKLFRALNIVGENQIDWYSDDALHIICNCYPKSQKGQNTILGLILFDLLYDSPLDYEYSRNKRDHSVKYCRI